MPYVNSRKYFDISLSDAAVEHLFPAGGEIVEKQAWSWDTPIVALISLWNVIRLL